MTEAASATEDKKMTDVPEPPELSIVAQFDDLMRIIYPLIHSDLTESFLEFVRHQEKCRLKWLEATEECRRLQTELNKSMVTISDLENKLSHARRLLDAERKLRVKAEREIEHLDRNMGLARDILFNDNKHKLADDTREKLQFLNNTTLKSRRSHDTGQHRLNTITEMDSTGSLLSDLSYSRSEDDIDSSNRWNPHRVSLNTEDPVKAKRRRSSNKTIEINANDRVIATTTLSMAKDGGPITATSIIETVADNEKPVQESNLYPEPIIDNLDAIAKNKYNTPGKFHTPTTLIIQDPTPRCRQHNFVSKTVIRPEMCSPCGKRIRFGKMAMRCRDCRAFTHSECQNLLPLPCVPVGNTPTLKGTMGSISDYTPAFPPMIPALIVHCVNEIELRGFNEIGLYRVPGSEKDVKVLKDKFLRGKGAPNLTAIEIPVICGAVKDFLRSLREPLITHLLWADFVRAVDVIDQKDTEPALYQAISDLPQPNRDTLAYLILHLQKVAQRPECKMPISNLAKVFGPTIVGYSSADPDPGNILSETRHQVAIVENLLNIPADYWTTFVNVGGLVPPVVTELRQTPSMDSVLRDHYTPRGFFTPLGSKSANKNKRKFFNTPPQSKK